MADDLKETILDAVEEGVKSAEVDGRKATAHSLPELIDADRHLASKNAAANSPAWGLRFAKIIPPGAG